MFRAPLSRWLACLAILVSGLGWSFVGANRGAADAPHERGTMAQTGAFPGPGPDVSVGLVELWRTDLDAPVVSRPVSSDGLLIIGDTTGRVSALDLVTGDLRWEWQLEDAVNASATIAEGVVYVGSNDGSVTALDLRDGQPLWIAHPGWHEIAAPTVADGVVYAGTDLGVVALDAADGSVRWEFPTGLGWVKSPTIGGGRVFAASQDRRLYALDAATGAERWRYDVAHPFIAAPVLSGNRVFAVTEDGQIHCLESSTGNVIWTSSGNFRGAPAVGSTGIFVANQDGAVHRVSLADGEAPLLPDLSVTPGSSLAVAGDAVLGVTPTGLLAASVDGSLLATFDVSGASSDPLGSPIVDESAIYAVSAAGVVIAVGGMPLILEAGGRATPLRDTALLGAPAPSAVIRATLSPGDDLLLLDEPETKGGVTYWPVEVMQSGLRGWVDENDLIATAMSTDRRRPTDSYSSTS